MRVLQDPVWESSDAFRSFPAIAVNADCDVVVVHGEFAAVGPVDESFWVIGEYPIKGKWATWVAQLRPRR